MNAPLEFSGVTFAYGRDPVLHDLHLQIEPGEITCLAAPNGTGKTTALWLAAGLLDPDKGDVRVYGAQPHRQRDCLADIGFFAEGSPFPPHWTVQRVLDYQRATFPRWDDEEHARLQGAFGLDPKRRVRSLSRGERGKLGLLVTLSTDPRLLLLDEPTLGLDLATRRLLLAEILGRAAERGCPVLVAGHEIAEAQTMCDRFVLLGNGHVQCDEAMETLLGRHRIVEWDDDIPDPPDRLDVVPLPRLSGQRGLAHSWDPELAQMWVTQGGREAPADLETIYLSLTGALEHA